MHMLKISWDIYKPDSLNCQVSYELSFIWVKEDALQADKTIKRFKSVCFSSDKIIVT